mmetsp:Transcript_17449/g.20934  ORF Transcript_17449/g.20934 Transcript_17449/m.20934 type:complete len:80 (+) Transcript_17449:267-506(+)|eukprot:CAMPEP_0197855098 /NCGR_PEP_ID=MMETSP1438-20131217/25968_1 /TAXON_ID=1461541 /ORGANISM="Pterosperma sp., Strain CCMP1384" /LENGTH=79 /DNA_ID=CAMNT_0043470079 /DNA_START=262 /DNA_END=501 /DNA_ORIENTATION=+
MGDKAQPTTLQEVLPKAGLVYSEKGNLSEVLCKPKIMPLKSVTLERLEEMEKAAATATAEANEAEKTAEEQAQASFAAS